MNALPEILAEDDHLLALAKPSGWLTEGGGDRETDLEQWASVHVRKTVHCCHRLDRLTSGVVLLRKNNRFTAALAETFAGHRVRKTYWALVDGAWPSERTKIETLIAPIAGERGRFANVASGGKPSVSTVRILGQTTTPPAVTWLSLLLKTGRTHQARLHCLAGGCPVLGDPLYGRADPAGFFGLHARELRLRHPADGRELQFTAAPPANWNALLQQCGGGAIIP